MSATEFEERLRAAASCATARGPGRRALSVTPRRGRAGVPAPHRAGEGRVRAGRDAARFRTQVTASDDEVKARFESAKDSYRDPRAARPRLRARRRGALRSRVAVTDRDLEAYYQEHKEEFKEQEQVCASHILVKVKATAEATDGHTDAEAPEPRRGAPREGEGRRRLRETREEELRGQGLGGARRRPRLLPAGSHGARVRRTPRSPSSPERPPTSSRAPSATTSSAWPRAARRRCRRWSRSRSASGRS